MTDQKHAREEKVVHYQYGAVKGDGNFPVDWPSGAQILETVQKHADDVREIGDETYWQASARYALLSKFGRLPEHFPTPRSVIEGASSVQRLVFTPDDIKVIQMTWEKLTTETLSNKSTKDDDLVDFIKTSKSNNRTLQWTVMDCAPACQFKLHAHPNIELIYCVRGALHEIRMTGDPVTTDFPSTGEVQGPNLNQLDRPWRFATLRAGQWLVNEVGSIHKSFTETNGDGCVLLVLWGGSHADISLQMEPHQINIQQTLEDMDKKLSTCHCTQWDTLEETFLPASERRV